MKQNYFKPQTELILIFQSQKMICASNVGASINDLTIEDELDGNSIFE